MNLLESTSKPVSEDCAFAGEDCWILLDGASALVQAPGFETMSAPAAYVRLLQKELAARMMENASLRQILEEANQAVSSHFANLLPDQKPSCTITLLRRRNGSFDWLVLGDSPLYLKTSQGALKISDDRVEAFDARVLDLMERLHQENGLPFLRQRENQQVKDLLLQNRRMKNRPQGYWICEPDQSGAEHAVTGSLPESEVQAAALMSDGFEQLAGFEQLDARGMLDAIAADPKGCMARLAAHQKKDPDCRTLRRLKISDDTTLLFIDFSKD